MAGVKGHWEVRREWLENWKEEMQEGFADTKGGTVFLCRALSSLSAGIHNLLVRLLLGGEDLAQDVLLVV